MKVAYGREGWLISWFPDASYCLLCFHRPAFIQMMSKVKLAADEKRQAVGPVVDFGIFMGKCVA